MVFIRSLISQTKYRHGTHVGNLKGRKGLREKGEEEGRERKGRERRKGGRGGEEKGREGKGKKKREEGEKKT